MNFLNLVNNALKVSSLPNQPYINSALKRFRKYSICDVCLRHQDKRPCFDLSKVTWVKANQCHANMISVFLNHHYWPREPTVVSLWMSLDSPYLQLLTDKYSNTGDRFLAFEKMNRTNEKKLVGVLVANTIFPWMIDELEEWGHYTYSKPERYRMFFCAHCLKAPNLFKKYNVPYIYDVEILGTAVETSGQGVATQLLRNALHLAQELRHPLVQVISLSHYTSAVCERCGMKREWSMNYDEFVDTAGKRVFFPRSPHHTVTIFVKYFNPALGGTLPCKPPY